MPSEDYTRDGMAGELLLGREAEWRLDGKSCERFAKDHELQDSPLTRLDRAELISTIIDAVPLIVLTCNERYIIEMVNSASAKLLGYPPERMVGHHIGEFLPNYGHYRRELGMASFLVPELAVMKSDGTVIQGELRGTRARVNDKPVIFMVISDASARKAAEAMKEGVYKQLYESRRMEAIGALSSGIAHELNTPIQFIGDNVKFVALALNKIHESYKRYDGLKCECEAAGLLPETVGRVNKYNSDIELPALIGEIMTAIRETMEGVSQVRDIALMMKEFSHPGTGAPAPADINQVVQSAVRICRSRHKDIAVVKTELAADLPSTPCRRGQIQQVLVNMIVNAVEAIEEQGVAEGIVHIETKRAQDAVRIEVSDNGPGIPRELREKIFDPFFTTKQVGKGTGQGLALAKDFIVNQHGGKLLLEHRPGFSTTFVIELPLTPRLATQARQPVRHA